MMSRNFPSLGSSGKGEREWRHGCPGPCDFSTYMHPNWRQKPFERGNAQDIRSVI